jgi:cell shape-determining protein MreC
MIPPAYARRLLPLTFVVLTILALLVPPRYLTWLSGFGRLSQTLTAPISHPLAALSRWLAGPIRGPRDSEEIRALEEDRESTKVQLLQALGENDRLRAMIKELQRGQELDPDIVVQQLTGVAVVGSATDVMDGLLTIRAGSRQNVDLRTVATAEGLQLVGRVVSVGTLTSTVAPITTKAAGAIRAMIMLDQTANGLTCTLAAVGDGTLSGDVEDRRDPATGATVEPAVGQEVRLSDPAHWPRSAQMLLIGRVEKVEPSPKQPLRKVVTVRPTLDNIERVSEVVLRIVPTSDSALPPPQPAHPRGGRP